MTFVGVGSQEASRSPASRRGFDFKTLGARNSLRGGPRSQRKSQKRAKQYQTKHQVVEITGAPGEIRTPDPQIVTVSTGWFSPAASTLPRAPGAPDARVPNRLGGPSFCLSFIPDGRPSRVALYPCRVSAAHSRFGAANGPCARSYREANVLAAFR